MRPIYLYSLIFITSCSSCVSVGAYNTLQKEKLKSDSLYGWAMQTLKTCQGDNDRLTRQRNSIQDQNKELNLQMTAISDNNTALRKQVSDLSAISSAQAESIRKSIDNIGAKDLYLQGLRMAISRRDSINLAALMEMKAAMGSFSDREVAIKVAKGVMNVDVSDSVLFGGDSASYTVTPKGKTILLRLARVLNDQTDIRCTVEGYTDSTSAEQDSVMDSWELSVRRAAAVVRLLQNQFNVTPSRLIAAGHGEFEPVAPNDSPEDRSANRRTRFRITPGNDELEEALEKR